jgi:hypothetical protein
VSGTFFSLTMPWPSGQVTPFRQPVGGRVCRPTDGRRYLLTPEVRYYGIMVTQEITFSLQAGPSLEIPLNREICKKGKR